MALVNKLKVLAKERNLSFSALERELGFGNGTIQKWDTSSPSCDKLLKLANFLNVSIDFLLRDDNSMSESSIDLYEHLISLYKAASDEDKLRVINYLELVNSLPPIKKPMAKKANILYSNPNIPSDNCLKTIPIRGYVAAGTPIEAIENNLGTATISSNLDADYALIVNGDSMAPIIKNNEYVYVKSVDKLSNDDIGVFYYNGSVTCKKFFKDDSTIKLISLNPDYEDFIFYLDDSKNEYINFTVEGKVLLSTEQAKRLKKYFTLNR